MRTFRHITFFFTFLVLLTAGQRVSAGSFPGRGFACPSVPDPPLRYSRVEHPDSLCVKLHFRKDVTRLEAQYRDNDSLLNEFVSGVKMILADTSCRISGIYVRSGASIEGTFDNNVRLSRGRGEILVDYLKNKLHFQDSLFLMNPVGEDWESFYSAVLESDLDMPHREDILRILEDHTDYIFSQRISVMGGPKKELMDLNGGADWYWLLDNILPYVRSTSVVCRFVRIGQVVSSVPAPSDTTVYEEEAAPPAVLRDTIPEKAYKKIHSRLGTNLLYDVFSVANLTLEFGFARHFAFNALVTYSPWDIRSDVKFRTLIIQPELRYYFAGNFIGQYVGVEGHYGWYNIAPGGKIRYQDKDGDTPLWGAGLSYGFVLPFSMHWGVDFSLSVGYAHLVYDCFYNTGNGARFTTGSREWWGPTKAGVIFYYQF